MRIFWGLNPLSQKAPVADLETVACKGSGGTWSEKSKLYAKQKHEVLEPCHH
jgi:hypothetical protein